MPLAGPVSFFGFMLLGPAVLIGLRAYLQIYVEHKDRLDRLVQRMGIIQAPTLVPLKNPLIRVVSILTFCALLPVAMLLFVWKAAVFPVWGTGLLCVAIGVIISHALLSLRRLSWRSKSLVSAAAAVLAGGVILGVGALHGETDLLGNSEVRFWFVDVNSTVLLGRPFNLDHADLSSQFLLHSDLHGADLRNAKLAKADLREAHLQLADLTDADLSGADLGDAMLEDANFRNANLNSANLVDADLLYARLSNTNLRGTNLRGADLRRVYLDGAKLSGANLTGATLLLPTGLTQAQLDRACGTIREWEAATNTHKFVQEITGDGRGPPPTIKPCLPDQPASGSAK